MKKTSFVLCTLVSAFSMQGTGIAADKWDFVIAPYLLAPNIDGKASIGRVEGADVDVGTTDGFCTIRSHTGFSSGWHSACN